MPQIQRITLERANDTGVHEIRSGERPEPVEPPAEKSPPREKRDPPGDDRPHDEPSPGQPPRRDPTPDPPPMRAPPDRKAKIHDQEEFERATTSFPGG